MSYDDMQLWEREELLDVRCIRLDAELEARAKIELEEEYEDGE